MQSLKKVNKIQHQKDRQLTSLKTFSSGSHVSSCSASVTLDSKPQQKTNNYNLGTKALPSKPVFFTAARTPRFIYDAMLRSPGPSLAALPFLQYLKTKLWQRGNWSMRATYNIRYVVRRFPRVMLGRKSFPAHPEFTAAIDLFLANNAINSKHVVDLSDVQSSAVGLSERIISLKTES